MGAEPLKLLNPQEALQLEQYARTATVSWAMEGPCSEQPGRWCSAADCCQTPRASLLRRLLNRGAR
jgi:hypothetical protein